MQLVLNRFSWFLSYIAMACLLLMMLQVVADVVLKYVANAPIENNLEIVSFYYMVAVVFLPLAMVEMRHEHINVDLFYRMLPRRLQTIVYSLASVAAASFFGILAYQTAIDAVRATHIGEVMMGTSLVPIWPSRWFLPIGLSATALICLNHAFQAVVNPHFDPEPETPELTEDETK
ncbi:TRAP transporter small permease [Hoeflea prorocentri]|uniref:TRAP transporter small permease protein n=1 Tax=Hoeflea prorocentri TaxID=1922333 RepID=A0A9X3UM34_9HYPH|nr:TRAP transporter small permease [Hoeflea prorocentri]MCY6383748.1 TRAP transporter small permease [Hoeflea prorocentri]MDA5401548.1 TRAP transporter small permease [Hoeflea prorocentri]